MRTPPQPSGVNSAAAGSLRLWNGGTKPPGTQTELLAGPAHHHSGDQRQWYNVTILETKAVAPVFLALLIGGCPKRQTVPRVVYVQPPPAASSTGVSNQPGGTVAHKTSADANQADASAGSMEALVIEEPSPPPPPAPVTEPAPAAAAPAAPAPRHKARPRTDSHDTEEAADATDSVTPASPSEMPSLQPMSNAGQNDGLESRLRAQDDDIKRRISELDKNPGLSDTERRTLKDATSFWSQSVAAVQEHDLLKAQELAQKASLLLAALEKR